MTTRFWLMKTEPGEFSIEDLERISDQTASWDGVRNYQARNFMRDQMQFGDGVLFYHSGKTPSVVGTASVVRTGYPDHTAWDSGSKHFDPRSTPQKPIWFMVDVRLERKFMTPIPLARLRTARGLENMMLLRRGMRLSVQPVTPEEFEIVLSLADAGPGS